MTVYTVALRKGGSTKTTTAAELVAHLAAAGRRVLAVDLDQQGNLSTRLGITAATVVAGDSAQLLTGEKEAAEVAVQSPSVAGAHVIIGTQALADAEQLPEVIVGLRDYLPSITGPGQAWDDVVIDTPPGTGTVTLAALAAADQVIAATAATAEAYEQVAGLAEVISHRVAPRLRPGQSIHWIVPAIVDERQRLDREVLDALREEHNGRVTRPIRKGVAARDAYTAGMPVSVYDPSSGVAADYLEAMRQVTGGVVAR